MAAMLSAILAYTLAACNGYVMVRVTPPLPTLTATAYVRLITITPRATATAVPATPLPTSTATPTPTPVIHVVQKGDLLLDIAEQYDVSVQVLIEVNHIENPNSLRIGQELIIPYGETNLLETLPTPTPTPMPLRIIHVAFHQTPTGGLWCMGEVENESDGPLEFVQVQISLHNTDGSPVKLAAAFIAAEIVPAHSVSPFAVLLPDILPGSFASYQIVVLSAEPLIHWGNRYAGLVVTDLAGEMSGDLFIVRGSAENRGVNDAQDVEIVFTAYAQDGTMAGVRRVRLDAPLAAGQRQSFSFSLIPAVPAANVRAVAWGIKTIP